jgi:hypothetical protein
LGRERVFRSPLERSTLGGERKRADRPIAPAQLTATLMANVCAYQFVLRPHEGQTSHACFDAVRDEMADWICEIYRAVGWQGVAVPFDGTCLAPHPTHELWSDQRVCATHRLASIEWVWPEGEDPTLSWMLACTTACDDKAVEVALIIRIVSRPFLLRPLHFILRENNPLAFLPSLANRLLHLWPAELGGWPIPTKARELRDKQIDEFYRATLHDPKRVLPVVVVNLAGPVQLRGNGLQDAQERLLGLAQVAALVNASAVQRLAKLLPDDPPWENCPARIYWPAVADDVPCNQELFSPADLEQQLQTRALDQVLLTKFLEFSAGRYREGDLIRATRLAVDRERADWRQVADTAERELSSLRTETRQAVEERERLRQECDTAWQLIHSLQGDLAALRETKPATGTAQSFDELATELEKAWDENRRLTAEIENERLELAELREELRVHQQNWSLLAAAPASEGKVARPEPTGERAFAEVAEALQAAAEDFADILVIWDDARQAADKSPYRMPGKVYRALRAIAEVGRAYFQARDGGPPLGPVEQAFSCRVPFKYSSFESETTMRMYGSERVFHLGNDSRQMQRHLRLGGGDTNNCIVIYFDFDDATQRVLIGYCGRHLHYHRQRT